MRTKKVFRVLDLVLITLTWQHWLQNLCRLSISTNFRNGSNAIPLQRVFLRLVVYVALFWFCFVSFSYNGNVLGGSFVMARSINIRAQSGFEQYWVGIIILYYSAFWSNLAFQFSNYSAISSLIRPSRFLIIRPSRFGLMVQLAFNTLLNLCSAISCNVIIAC